MKFYNIKKEVSEKMRSGGSGFAERPFLLVEQNPVPRVSIFSMQILSFYDIINFILEIVWNS